MRECWTVWVARCCLCDSFQMFAEKDKREEKLEDWIWYNMCVFLSSRLPEPRAEPMNPRDFEDNDSGPSMDHAPWYKKIRLLLRPPVLHCLLQPAISSLELSGWPSLCQPAISLGPRPPLSVPAGSKVTLKKATVTNMDSHIFSTQTFLIPH